VYPEGARETGTLDAASRFGAVSGAEPEDPPEPADDAPPFELPAEPPKAALDMPAVAADDEPAEELGAPAIALTPPAAAPAAPAGLAAPPLGAPAVMAAPPLDVPAATAAPPFAELPGLPEESLPAQLVASATSDGKTTTQTESGKPGRSTLSVIYSEGQTLG